MSFPFHSLSLRPQCSGPNDAVPLEFRRLLVTRLDSLPPLLPMPIEFLGVRIKYHRVPYPLLITGTGQKGCLMVFFLSNGLDLMEGVSLVVQTERWSVETARRGSQTGSSFCGDQRSWNRGWECLIVALVFVSVSLTFHQFFFRSFPITLSSICTRIEVECLTINSWTVKPIELFRLTGRGADCQPSIKQQPLLQYRKETLGKINKYKLILYRPENCLVNRKIPSAPAAVINTSKKRRSLFKLTWQRTRDKIGMDKHAENKDFPRIYAVNKTLRPRTHTTTANITLGDIRMQILASWRPGAGDIDSIYEYTFTFVSHPWT